MNIRQPDRQTTIATQHNRRVLFKNKQINKLLKGLQLESPLSQQFINQQFWPRATSNKNKNANNDNYGKYSSRPLRSVELTFKADSRHARNPLKPPPRPLALSNPNPAQFLCAAPTPTEAATTHQFKSLVSA